MRRLLLVALLGATAPVLAACGGGEAEPAASSPCELHPGMKGKVIVH